MNNDQTAAALAELGSLVFAHDVIGQHSEETAEDGRTVRLHDLTDGRTGVQSFLPGTEPGPIRYAD